MKSELSSDDEKHELNTVADTEREGFGSVGPPPQLQSLISEWIQSLLSNAAKNKVMLSKQIYILYALDIFKHTLKLPTSETMVIYNILKRIEKWILGINLTEKFRQNIQKYYQMVIAHLFGLFEIDMSVFSDRNKLHKKLNLIAYAIYLLRLISGEPYIKFSRQTWQCLVNGMVKSIKYFQTNSKKKFAANLDIIEDRVVHPLIHCLFKSFILMSISDIKTGTHTYTLCKDIAHNMYTYT